MIKRADFITVPYTIKDDKAISFRKDFDAKDIKRVTLYASAYGMYEAYINGKRVSDYVFAPGWTSYFSHMQYQTYDITDLVKDKNTVDITVGTGWSYGMGYQAKMTRTNTCVIAYIDIEHADGTHSEVKTDPTWEIYSTPITDSTVYGGETYDATITPERIEGTPKIPGREKATLMPQHGEIIKEHESYPALEVIKTPAGETVLDFGYNLVGYVEITIPNGKAGDEISYTHAEILDKHGNFYTDNLRSAKQRITYTAKDGFQTYKPHFTFMGGRYIRLDKYPYDIDLNNFKFIVVHSDIKRTGYFECSDTRVNKLFDNIIRGQRGNYLDIPTDCPQRDERLGWTGDAEVFVRAAAYNYDVEKFFDKWLYDLMMDQRGDGSVPSVIPDVHELCTYRSAAWQDAATVCPWEIYLAYGNKQLLERQYESMCRYIGYLDRLGGDKYMWNGENRHYGDWLAMDTPGDNKGGTSHKYIAQCYYAYSTSLVIKAGRVLGRDVSYYEKLYDGIVDAFRTHYMKDGLPVFRTQTACILALHFRLCEEKDRTAVADLLCELIHERGDTLCTGFVGTPYIMHTLTETGHSDLAYTLLLTDKFPSWLYSVKMGATTIWEHWDGINENGDIWSPSMNSYNHYAYGAVADWMYGVAAGINIDEKKPAYKNVILAPVPDKRLGFVKASVDTRQGTVKSEWSIDGDTVTYSFTVPNEADIIIDGKTTHVTKGDYTFTSSI